MKDHLLHQYDRTFEQIKSNEVLVLQIFRTLLTQHQQNIHSFNSRIKSRRSLERKISRPDKTYHSLDDISDILGLRIVTYFENTVEDIASLIESHLSVDFSKSVDKRKSGDSSHFGYRSLHYVCSLKNPRPDPQSSAAGSIQFEVQIRTILQHAWAEIEHDLGYKSEESIPQEFRRRFSRLAGLLEIADAEFSSIRESLQEYERVIQQKYGQKDRRLEVNRFSLECFLREPVVTEIEQKFADRIGVSLSNEHFFPEYLLRMLHAVGIVSISDLREILIHSQERILDFIHPYFEFTKKTWQFGSDDISNFLRGYSIIFLSHFVLLDSCSLSIEHIEKLTKFYRTIDYPNDENTAQSVAVIFVESMRQSVPHTTNALKIGTD